MCSANEICASPFYALTNEMCMSYCALESLIEVDIHADIIYLETKYISKYVFALVLDVSYACWIYCFEYIFMLQ